MNLIQVFLLFLVIPQILVIGYNLIIILQLINNLIILKRILYKLQLHVLHLLLYMKLVLLL